ncbi:MAG: phosphoribosylformylglycinamidine synthase subunit PurL [Verrucomicrobiales bacterium]|nr:phosphoribosylformylglycinamidine synthase subunit PurL [Verrucomicrobiales bacterium]
MTEPSVTPELVAAHNLTPEEYERIKAILGREPTYTELGIFSVMWSEHCSYKSTKHLLRMLPTRSPRVLVGAGEENAGIIDIGDGLAIAFKVESHNHPSAVEPFQGAATGVGGIIRDIFTMGARPICALDSLRFGPITSGLGNTRVLPGPASPGSVNPGEASRRQDAPATAAPAPCAQHPQKSEILNPKSETDQSLVIPTPTNGEEEAAIKNNRRLFAGVVAGIAHYGNCFGIPTIAGEVYFDKCYEGNPLVNVFCLGVLRHDQIVRARAKGIGNPVFYVGPPTGRDGLAGAAFASQDLTEDSAEHQRGAVQVGDPFMEKLLCEACLELLATGAVAGMQDMGAAGLTCSTCETAARAGTGIEIDLDKVPQRAPNMTSYEIMLSESQERMLIIVHKGREDEVKRIFDKWDLPWAEIGVVTDTGRMVVKHKGRVVADIPAKALASDSPVYVREAREPAYLKEVRAFRLSDVPDVSDVSGTLKRLLAWPTIASKNWVYRQYDHMVRNGSVVCPGSDAAVVRIKADSLPEVGSASAQPDSRSPGLGQSDQASGAAPDAARVARAFPNSFPEKFIAITSDCNATYVYLDPYEGSKIAVAEAARNLACSGAVPLGITDNLNFGSPLNPEIYWQLVESVRGLADACRALDIPVTGGNCSLYNQSPLGAIDPTPTVVMVGQIERAEDITTQWFKDEGDAIVLLGAPVDMADPLQGLGGSAYLQVVHGKKTGSPPRCDLEQARTLHTTLIGLIRSGLIKSAHDCSEGGLAVCLAECCISQQIARNVPRLIGAAVDLTQCVAGLGHGAGAAEQSAPRRGASEVDIGLRLDALLFGETQNRVVVTCAALDAVKVVERARLMGVPAARIGTVGGEKLVIRTPGGEVGWDVRELHDLWWNAIARAMA